MLEATALTLKIALPAALTGLSSLSAGLVAPPEGDAPPVQRPKATSETPPSQAAPAPDSDPSAPEDSEPSTDVDGADPDGTAPPESGEPDGIVPEAPDAAAPEAVTPGEDAAADDGAVPEDLLGAEPAPATAAPPRRPPAATPSESVSNDEKLKRYYNQKYRPESNPAMLRVAAHGLFLAASGKDMAGRLGGAQVEVGQAWNRVGYGIGLAAYGGETLLGPNQYSVSYGMFGGGPTISLGRTALLARGYLDVSAGYDFFYMPAGDSFLAVRDGTMGESFFAPHGPRVRLDLGLISQRRDRKYRHGMGFSLGWQGLVSSLAGGDLAYSNVLMIGVSYMMQ